MADARFIENRFTAISQLFVLRLTRHLKFEAKITFTHSSRGKTNNFRRFKMVDGRHIENGFIAISQPGIRFQ